MCGIAGIFSFQGLTDENVIHCHAAIKSLSNRGPDYQTSLQYGNVCLGHSRLSIIDPSTEANQPFQDKSKRFVLIFNGEIYNFRQLRKQLKSQHHISFETESDTEVLLYWLIKEGIKGLNHLNGFFSFALLDKERETLFVARDRYGIKPFIYAHNQQSFVFASEMKALEKFQFKKIVEVGS